MGKIEIRATTDGSGGIKFVGSVCEPSEGESSSRMRAEIIWRLAELWRADLERYDAYCYDGKEIRKLDNGEPQNPKREEV